MALTNKIKQRRYRERMYKAGLKPCQIWVYRNEPKRTGKMNRTEFIRKLRQITGRGWSEESLSKLYLLLLKVTRGKKGENKLKKTE